MEDAFTIIKYQNIKFNVWILKPCSSIDGGMPNKVFKINKVHIKELVWLQDNHNIIFFVNIYYLSKFLIFTMTIMVLLSEPMIPFKSIQLYIL